MRWGYVGPQLITELFIQYCYTEENSDCQDMFILPANAIQPVIGGEFAIYFQPKATENDSFFLNVCIQS